MVQAGSRALMLSSVEVGAARAVGLDPDRLRRAFLLLDEWVRAGVLPGAAALIARHGAIAGEAYLGLAQSARRRPVDSSTIWSLASITKPFTAAAVMQLVEDGVVSLDEPLWRLVPEFMDAPRTAFDREAVTLRHVLAHCSGLPGFSEDNTELRRARRPLEDFVRSFGRQPILFAPGTAHLYSNPGILMAAEVVARADAGQLGVRLEAPAVRRYHDVVQRRILAPLAMRDSSLLPPPQWSDRFAWGEAPGHDGAVWEVSEAPYYRSLGFPWGGMYSTPRDLLRFVDGFRSPGGHVTDPGAPRVLGPSAARAMIQVQFTPPDAPPDLAPGQRDSASRRPPLTAVPWGIGWEVKGTKPAHRSGDLTSPATFGHTGATGTLVWCDPACGVTCILLTNRPLSTGWTVDPPRHTRFSNAVMAAVES
jgi:CubicO group peptidase (beta-lactamase class C family)